MTFEKEYPVEYEIKELFHWIRDEEDIKDDSQDDSSEEEDLEQDEETPDDNTDDNADLDDSEDGKISVEAYKGLQRTIAKRDKELERLKKEADEIRSDYDEFRSSVDADTVVRQELQKTLSKAMNRIEKLEEENKASKTEAMQSNILMDEFPSLTKLKEYIPSAETEDEFRENCKNFSAALGENITEALEEELAGTTVEVEDEKTNGVTQAQIDKAHEKAQSLAIPGKEKEYNKAMDEYLDLLARAEV